MPRSFSPTDVIDIHVHIAGPAGENEKMYYVSEEFKRSTSFEGVKLVTKLREEQITGPRYVSVLFSQVRESRHVDKAVLLALDAVYGEDGHLRREATHLYVANDYCAGLARIYPVFLFGCSVHPYAPDALERLWYCARDGAVLCKWLPSAQCIDPTHPLAERFYRALALLGLPLLMHVGPEETIPTVLDTTDELLFNAAAGRYGSRPGDGISLALQNGATLIVAHAATPLGPLFDRHNEYWEQVFALLLERVAQVAAHVPLYADMSAFCLPGRFEYVAQVLPLARRMPHRFLYGSDYPIPVISFRKKGLGALLDAFGWLAGRALPVNDFDKSFELLRVRFPMETFTSAARVLRAPDRPMPELDAYLRRLGVKRRKFFLFG
ncbi:MAG: amidohydrolase family protein [bacterium]|jgi:mannonate dehydratase|nr:amidohydrolase family protein [candidate division KSB1 bacterium]MDH7560498.1 amidohydrolase family protein [bacterium]